jgi:hypothetical protein
LVSIVLRISPDERGKFDVLSGRIKPTMKRTIWTLRLPNGPLSVDQSMDGGSQML